LVFQRIFDADRSGCRRFGIKLQSVTIMGKSQNSKKETKKAPQKTAKEKRQAKREKKG